MEWAGEITELRASDISENIETLSVLRAVTHRGDCHIDTPKSGKTGTVAIPPHIRADIKHHLETYVPETHSGAFLFAATNRSRCGHLNETVFKRSAFRPASEAIGRNDVRIDDLPHFPGTSSCASWELS